MAFRNLIEIVKGCGVFYDIQPIVSKADLKILLPKSSSERIQLNLIETIYDVSEVAIYKSITYPILQKAWKEFKKILRLWSHVDIDSNETLNDIPDYIIAKKSESGKTLNTLLAATIEKLGFIVYRDASIRYRNDFSSSLFV